MTDAPAPRRAFARDDDVIASYVHELAATAGWPARARGDRPAAVSRPRPIARPRGRCAARRA